MSVNINIGPSQPRMPQMPTMPGCMPGMGMPGYGTGIPGLSVDGGHNHNGGCCDSKKGKEKKDKGIIGEIFEGIFGEDGLLGVIFGGGKKDKKECKKGCKNGQGGINININGSQRASGLGC